MIIKVAFFSVLISLNYLTGYCAEKTGANEESSDLYERTELSSTDAIPPEVKYDNDNDDLNKEVGKTETKEKRESSTSKHFLEDKDEIDDFSDITSTEAFRVQNTSRDEKAGSEQIPDEYKKTNERKSSLEEERKTVNDNIERQTEELSNIFESITEINEKNAEDLSEASAENKLSYNEKTSSMLRENDRTDSKNGEVNENSDEVFLEKTVSTRRMLSNDDVLLETKARSDEGPFVTAPEDAIANNPNINIYNNFEFGSRSNSRSAVPAADVNQIHSNTLIPLSTTTDSTISFQTTTPPITGAITKQDILQPQNLPNFYPRSELNLDFPKFDVQQQEPRAIPFYLELINQDPRLSNNFLGSRGPPNHQSQENFLNNKQYRKLRPELKIQDQKFHESQSITNSKAATGITVNANNYEPKNDVRQLQLQGKGNNNLPLDNIQFENWSHKSRIQVPQYYTNQAVLDYKPSVEKRYFENIGHEPINQFKSFQNRANMPLQNKQPENFSYEQINKLQQPYRAQGVEPSISLENKGFENLSKHDFENANPYSYIQQIRKPEAGIPKTPVTSYNPSTKNSKSVFQTLADATEYPKKVYLQNSEIKEPYPNFYNPRKNGFYTYDLSYTAPF